MPNNQQPAASGQESSLFSNELFNFFNGSSKKRNSKTQISQNEPSILKYNSTPAAPKDSYTYFQVNSTDPNYKIYQKEADGKNQILKSNVLQDDYYAALIPVLNDFLYFHCLEKPPVSPSDAHTFTVDFIFNYVPFFSDVGPLNLAHIYRFNQYLNDKLKTFPNKKLVMYSSPVNPDKVTNAVLLLTSYLVLNRQFSPLDAIQIFKNPQNTHKVPLIQFRDAGYGQATYWITVLDCLIALEKGLKQFQLYDFFNMKKGYPFDIEEYEFYEKVENGDLNWIIPGVFLALATPNDQPAPHLLRYHQDVQNGRIQPIKPVSKRFKPVIELPNLLDYLKKINVKAMIRLNNKLYDRQKCLDAGLEHYELFFPDGSCPPMEIIEKFMKIIHQHYCILGHAQTPGYLNKNIPDGQVEKTRAVAVHCKAGLGRTGSLICCWMMKTFEWSARECISWCRLMRPGSVVGPQQNWLETMEPKMIAWGREERRKNESFLIKQENWLLLSFNEKRSNTELRQQTNSNMNIINLIANEGTDLLSSETNGGMSVPSQPRKDMDLYHGTKRRISKISIDDTKVNH